MCTSCDRMKAEIKGQCKSCYYSYIAIRVVLCLSVLASLILFIVRQGMGDGHIWN